VGARNHRRNPRHDPPRRHRAFGLYIVGAVLTYVGIVQPGVITVFAVGYLALVVLVPLRLGRTMRAKGRSWRATLAATAAAIAAICLAFFPFAAITMTM
jgi:hypothetical protein